MADLMPVQELAEAIFKMVEEAQGKKKLKSGDLQKAMMAQFGDKVDRKLFKAAMRELMDNGRCVYTYFGGSFVELPHREGAAND